MTTTSCGGKVGGRHDVLLQGDGLLVYFPMLDKIINQLKFRFVNKESRIVYDVASVMMSSEQRMFNHFKVRIIFCVKQ